MYNESDLIHGIRNQEAEALRYAYREYFPMILDLITKNGGSDEDGADIFQEGMVVLYQKVQDINFEWRSTLKTYLFAVCRNKWLMELRRRKTKNTSSMEDNFSLADEHSIQKDIISNERNELMRRHFQNLGDDCQQVLKLFFASTSLRDIGKIMGFSEAYAKKKKFTCQQKLIETVMADPIYKELTIYDKRG